LSLSPSGFLSLSPPSGSSGRFGSFGSDGLVGSGNLPISFKRAMISAIPFWSSSHKCSSVSFNSRIAAFIKALPKIVFQKGVPTIFFVTFTFGYHSVFVLSSSIKKYWYVDKLGIVA
jgi:hypothetical protein